ncbi:MAG: FHA domain-containing protein, partial [Kiritimatiellaeota bacterium]|nr:FHA domain-containing protein [Kiritimatiellota bacterium]
MKKTAPPRRHPKAPGLRLELNNRVLFEAGGATIADTLRIGRAPDCAWRVPAADKTASNHHAVILWKRGRLVIRDDGSKNGLYCKGVKFAEHRLEPGDIIAIGDCRLVVEPPPAASAGDGLEFHRLEQLNGAGAGRVFELRGETVRIGSDPSCDIVCDDPLVSHRHVELAFKRDGACWARDLESRNGSAVNKAPLRGTDRMLRDGDILSAAHLEFRFLDKTAVHVRSHLAAKAVAAAVTLAAGVVLFYTWNIISPDSRTLVERAVAAVSAGRFDEAGALMEKAATARSAAAYRDRRLAVLRDMPEWRQTLSSWDDARSKLKARSWNAARAAFFNTTSWPPGMKGVEKDAILAKNLNEAFLNARNELTKDVKSTGKTIEILVEKGALLDAALRDATGPRDTL